MAGSESRGRGGRWRWRGREDEFSTSGPGLTDEQQQQLSRVADELLKRYTITPKVPGREPEPARLDSAPDVSETAWPVMPEGAATDVVDEVAQALSASYHVEAIKPLEPGIEAEVAEIAEVAVEPEPVVVAEPELEVEPEPVIEPAPRGRRPSLIDRWLHPEHRGEIGSPPDQELAEEVEEPVALLEPEPEPEPVAVVEVEPEPEPVPLTKEELSAALIEVFEFDSDWFIKEDLPSAPELEFESSAVSTGTPVAEDEQPLVWSERELDDESMGDLEFTRALLTEPVQMNAPEAPARESEPEAEPESLVAAVVEPLTPPEPEPADDVESADQRQMIIEETESEMAQREVAELEAALEAALQTEREASERAAAARVRLADARAALATLQDLEAQGVQRRD